MIDIDGQYDPLRKDVLCKREDFQGTLPVAKNIVEVDDVKFHVEQIEDDPKTKVVRLTLKRLK
jgi:hypothetical protein